MAVCENASTTGHNIGIPQCFSSKATRQVTVKYNDVETNILTLCNDCAEAVAADARRHHYEVTNRPL